jgi:aerobic C4-dicarboxylate transport protein
MHRLFKNLTFWVLLAICSGAVVGHYWPATGVQMEVLGKTFISIVKLFIAPLIFLTITLGIAGMGNLKRVGMVGTKSLLYFEVVTTFALLIGMAVAWIVQPGAGVMGPTQATNVATYVQRAETFSWWQFFKENLTIQVLLASILIGSMLQQWSGRAAVIGRLGQVSKLVFKALHYVMLLAPIGAFGGMAYTIGKFGIAAMVPLAKLMLTVYCTMAIFIFGVMGLILWHYRVSLRAFLRYIKEELLIVLGTSSSEAALPALMTKLERMGCSKAVVGLVIPSGYSFNLDGTTIYLSMATIFLAQVYHIDLTWSQILTMIGVLMVTSKGAAGVTGSGFVVLASTLTAIQVIPVEGLALLLGVDRFMSEARAITNFIGNGVAAIFISNHEGDFDREMMEREFLIH